MFVISPSRLKHMFFGLMIGFHVAAAGASYAQDIAASDHPFKAFNPEDRKIDPRLGIIHVGSQYPDRTREGDMLVYGSQAAADLGFQTLEVFLDPRICRAANGKTVKFSLYQTSKYCDPDAQRRMLAPDLKTLAAHPDYATVFGDPAIMRYVITFDPLDPKAANQSLISKLDRDWTPEELRLLYDEVKQLTTYLLTTYDNTGKVFILSAPSEMDWHLTSVGPERGGCNRGDDSCATTDANPQAVQNTIAYLNEIARAITDGKAEAGPRSNIDVKQACEINFVVRSAPTLKTGLTEVIPHTRCDYVAWSAHEAFRAIQAGFDQNEKIRRGGKKGANNDLSPNPEAVIRQGLDRISQFPPIGKSVGYKDIFIGEIGFKENHDNLDAFIATIRAALDWGVYSVDLWELFDNSCRKFDPTAAEAIKGKACKGFWLLKPGAEKDTVVPSALLGALYDNFSAAAP